MNWLLETLTEPSMIQAVAVISIVAAVGVYLGRLKIFGISLGITFVFFAGIMAGHLGITVNKDMLNFAQNFGLIVFVYTLGLQVGPGFFSSLKKGGVEMNTMGLGVIALGLILTLVFHWITGISVPVMVGLLSGAVTNTPALGAAQQALLQMDPENTRNVTDMALACAVAYPLGVVGVILAIIILRSLFAKKTQNTHKEQDTTTNVAEFQVLNPSIYNKSIQQVMKLTEKHFVISRLWRNGNVTIPTSETILKEKDHLLIISVKADVESIKVLFGEQETTDWNKEDIDWNAIDSQLISRRIVVTRNRVNGVKLGSLRLRNLYGINITRVNRAGIDLVASRYGVRMQGATNIALTKLDVLSYMERIPVCAAYEVDGQITHEFPFPVLLDQAKPVTEYLPGWHCDISGVRTWEELPQAARDYVTYVEQAIGCRIGYVSVGAERDSLILR